MSHDINHNSHNMRICVFIHIIYSVGELNKYLNNSDEMCSYRTKGKRKERKE